uniref:AIG1-type G domain-containing protein n=1 Tax=Rhizochromulina marina TaxID=1034831 RepID=A0A7S2W8J9_9STRA|mmetsp:Transcript_17268/g.50337  ORF Transcript_17268/g.50337 Transcript_17268/m.50337 type:complete len:347 (+) Transcript_17268:66-1106(+)
MAAVLEGKERTVVLLGKTGRGKSATANTLVGSSAFVSRRSASAVTRTCEVHSAALHDQGLTIHAIDTPGLFDPGQSNAVVVKELAKCLELAPRGLIHAFLFVLNGDDARFTAEEQFGLRLLHLLYGRRALDRGIFVFTRGDCFDSPEIFESEILQPVLQSLCSEPSLDCGASRVGGGEASLGQWILLAGSRALLVDNIHRPPDQVQKLITMVDGLDETSGGAYSMEDFQAHHGALTEAQRRTLENPLSPEKQEEAARHLAGQVHSLRGEVQSLRSMMRQMTAEQNSVILQAVQSLAAGMQHQPAPPPPPPPLLDAASANMDERTPPDTKGEEEHQQAPSSDPGTGK